MTFIAKEDSIAHPLYTALCGAVEVMMGAERILHQCVQFLSRRLVAGL